MGIIKSSHPPFSFTPEQYDGLLAASLSATIVSLLASFAGLVVHFLLLWYDHHRPDNENYNTRFGSKPHTSTSSIVVKDRMSGTGRYDLKAIQQDRRTSNFDSSLVMRTHNRRHGVSKRGSSTGTMNRVSLRLIVLACISYSIYSVSQLVVTGITENVLACRVLAYFIVSFDVMGSMCLGLVGFNLVLVFVVNVKHPERFEKYYYATAVLISIFVFVPPLVLKAGRTIDKHDSCWYHFFFEGRKANPFNWLYYYSWLLFASILATVSSIIAIRKVILEKNNFAHTINMLNREEAAYPRPTMYPVASSASTHFQRNTNPSTTISQQPQHSHTFPKTNTEKNSELFRRVAIRCICYALVPVLCKSWGIGIEIAITSGIVVNYPILVIDRFMACIMGFCVSCIYFSDPSVRMVWQDMMIDYKKRYVDQFYYVDITKVIRLERIPNNNNPLCDIRRQHHQEEKEADTVETINITKKAASNRMTHLHPNSQRHVYTIVNFAFTTAKKRTKSDCVPEPEPVYIYDSALRRPMKYHPPRNIFHYLFSCHKHCQGEVLTEKQSTSCSLFPFNYVKRKGKNIRWIPMRRIDAPLSHWQNRSMMDDAHSTESQQSAMSRGTSELLHGRCSSSTNQINDKNASINDYKRHKNRLLEPYSHPKLAKFIYWVFVKLLFYRPPYYHRQKRNFERKMEKGKEKSHRQPREIICSDFPVEIISEDSFSCTNEYASMTDGTSDDSDRNITPHSSTTNERDDRSGCNNVNVGSAVSSSSLSSLSQYHGIIQSRSIASEPKSTALQQQAAEKTLNDVTVTQHAANSSSITLSSPYSYSLIQNNQSSKAFGLVEQPQLPPPLRPGSKNRIMSSSFIKSNHEKARRLKESITLGEATSRRSSSYPLSASSNVLATASSNRLPSTPSAKMLSKQHGKTKRSDSPCPNGNAPYSLERAFLDQKLPLKRQHEGPSHRHIPTIGQLVQSVSPVHSFMSVRRAAGNPFPQTPAMRPVSVTTGPSSLQSSPVAASSPTSLPKHDIQGSTTSFEKRDSCAQWSKTQSRLYQSHVLYHDYPNWSSPPRQKIRHPLNDDRKEGIERMGDEYGQARIQAKDDSERSCPYCRKRYNDMNVYNSSNYIISNSSMNDSVVTSPGEIDPEQRYPEAMKTICDGGKIIDEYNETCGEITEKNNKALTIACINDYYEAYLGSSTLPYQGRITFQPYISGQHQQQSFFIEGRGLSPPSKQHYSFKCRQSARIPSFKKKSTNVDMSPNLEVLPPREKYRLNGHDSSSTSAISSPKRKNIIRLQKIEKRRTSSLSAATHDHHRSNTDDKILRKTETHNSYYHNVQTCTYADKEIIFSGVRTTLLHIKNDMDIDDKTGIDNQLRNERDRIDILVDNWALKF